MKKHLTFALAAVVALSAAPAVALDCDAGFRAFEHALGDTCIPDNPQRIVAPRGSNIASPLMDIGAPIIGTGFRTMEDGSTYVRVASDVFGDAFVESYGLASVGDPNRFDVEAIAALDPDLIILNEWQANNADQTDQIAPTIVIPTRIPFLVHLAWLADAAGMSGVYEEREAAYRAQIEEMKALIGDPSSITVSRLDIADDGIWYYPNWGAIDQVINDVGFAKPAVQAEEKDGFNGMSLERIGEFDGDLILISHAPRFGQDIETLLNGWMAQGGGLWKSLPGAAAGNYYFYERDIMVGYTFESLNRSIEFLSLIAAGREFD